MFFIHIFYVLCFFVLVKSFCKKNQKFKTDLMTSFILLLPKTKRKLDRSHTNKPS